MHIDLTVERVDCPNCTLEHPTTYYQGGDGSAICALCDNPWVRRDDILPGMVPASIASAFRLGAKEEAREAYLAFQDSQGAHVPEHHYNTWRVRCGRRHG
jgi:hypothetical protein